MSRSEFLNSISKYIVSEGKKRGYKIFSPIIAQAIIESRWGESTLAKYNNFFGMKTGSHWNGGSVNLKTKEEYKPGNVVEIRDNFRTYPSMKAGVEGYFDFIGTKRYENLRSARTPEQFCANLKADGYATSSSYVKTLISCIDNQGLRKYDGVTEGIVNAMGKPVDTIAREVIDGKWGNGLDRKNRLHAAGYDYAVIQKRVNEILKGA